jgi:hypothetical protein
LHHFSGFPHQGSALEHHWIKQARGYPRAGVFSLWIRQGKGYALPVAMPGQCCSGQALTGDEYAHKKTPRGLIHEGLKLGAVV